MDGWATAGVLTDPDAGVILADTGEMLATADIQLTVIVASQYARRVILALRDDTNATDVITQRIYVGSDTTLSLPSMVGINVLINQRIVIRTENAVVGDVQATLNW